jgi:hypothetical protein
LHRRAPFSFCAALSRKRIAIACGFAQRHLPARRLQTNHCKMLGSVHTSRFAGEGTMSQYQAQWISKDRIRSLRKAGGWKNAILLDSFKGFIIIEPTGEMYGDGDVLSDEAADYELRPEWCTGSKRQLTEARRLLRLDADEGTEKAHMPKSWPSVESSNGVRTRP